MITYTDKDSAEKLEECGACVLVMDVLKVHWKEHCAVAEQVQQSACDCYHTMNCVFNGTGTSDIQKMIRALYYRQTGFTVSSLESS
jgi:hypothetical protein